MPRRRPLDARYRAAARSARRYASPYALAGLRRRRGRVDPKVAVGAVAAVAVFAAVHSAGTHGTKATGPGGGAHADVVRKQAPRKPASPSSGAETRAQREVVAYAWRQVHAGVPYVWGGTSPSGMDCSGLSMNAWASAGVSIDRTSQDQWTSEKHVAASQVQPGDLVFFAGSDGTPAEPGHVGIVINPAAYQMIDEYASGFDAETDHYGPGQSTKAGNDPVVGFTDPEGGA